MAPPYRRHQVSCFLCSAAAPPRHLKGERLLPHCFLTWYQKLTFYSRFFVNFTTETKSPLCTKSFFCFDKALLPFLSWHYKQWKQIISRKKRWNKISMLPHISAHGDWSTRSLPPLSFFILCHWSASTLLPQISCKLRANVSDNKKIIFQHAEPGADPVSMCRGGGDFNDMWQSTLITGSLL